MSEIKNDPGGKKQILVSIISSLTAIILLYLSTTGASLRCTEEGNCEIHRKNFLTDSLDKFNWKEVKAVQYTLGSEGYSNSTNRRGAFTTNLLLDLGNEKTIPIFVSGVAWSFGELDRSGLQKAIEKGKIENRIWAISFGGVNLIVSILFGTISVFFILFQIITPITPEMTGQALEKARTKNLARFLLLLVVSITIWSCYIGYLVYTFAIGL